MFDIFEHEDMDKLLGNVKREYDRLKVELEDAQKTIRDYRKEDEIKRLADEIDSLHRHSLCILSDKELQMKKEFIDKHYNMHGRMYNEHVYRLCGTGIGTIIKMTCPICNETIDITDTSSW